MNYVCRYCSNTFRDDQGFLCNFTSPFYVDVCHTTRRDWTEHLKLPFDSPETDAVLQQRYLESISIEHDSLSADKIGALNGTPADNCKKVSLIKRPLTLLPKEAHFICHDEDTNCFHLLLEKKAILRFALNENAKSSFSLLTGFPKF